VVLSGELAQQIDADEVIHRSQREPIILLEEVVGGSRFIHPCTVPSIGQDSYIYPSMYCRALSGIFLDVFFMPLFFTTLVAEGLLRLFGLDSKYAAFLPSRK
jgi:hypothetical protein